MVGKEAIEVKYSIVRPEALKTDSITQNPGATALMAGTLDTTLVYQSSGRIGRSCLSVPFSGKGGSAENPQNRWWGCEVHFRRSCDELFGLDHNKQMVAKFTQAARTLAQDDRPNQVILDELGIDDDLIHKIVGDIRDQTRAMMREIRLMFAQRRDQIRRKKVVREAQRRRPWILPLRQTEERHSGR